MKSTLFALLFFCATAAFGQTAGSALSNVPQPIQMASHQEHTTQAFMQTGQSLIGSYGNTSATGERPLWEVGAKPPAEVPLGDVARLVRTQHADAKKAVKTFEK